MLYVFVVIEHGTRRLAHVNVTARPGADWTLQQLRELVGDAAGYKYLIHDRDRIVAKRLDESIKALGLEVLRSLVESPKANAICERVIGTIRREWLDWLIPQSEAHLRSLLNGWVTHCNGGRLHSALGPGVPDPPKESVVIPKAQSRHRLAVGTAVLAKSVLDGLHHEYSLATAGGGALMFAKKCAETRAARFIAEWNLQLVLFTTGLLVCLFVPLFLDIQSIGMPLAAFVRILTRLQWACYKKHL